MKIRSSFVSNSSSCSFIINTRKLDDHQIEMALNPKKYDSRTDAYVYDDGDSWNVELINRDGEQFIKAYTSMDNYDYMNFLSVVVGVDDDDINDEY